MALFEFAIFSVRARAKTFVVPEGPDVGGWNSFKEALARTTAGPQYCQVSANVGAVDSNRLVNNILFAVVATGVNSVYLPPDSARTFSPKEQIWAVV